MKKTTELMKKSDEKTFNENIKIQNHSDIPVVRISNIYHEISKYPVIYDQAFLDAVKTIFDNNNKPSIKYDTVQIDNVEKEIEDINEIVLNSFGSFEILEQFLKEFNIEEL